MYGLLALAVVIAFGGGCTSEKHRPQKGQSRKEALQQWQDMKFGMFIHWGIYALAEGIWKGQEIPKLGEQIQRHASIPQDEYAELAGRFNPVKFDADEYVRIAKDAGMKYIVITSKHHDGFNMFHTKLSDYNVVDATPYGRDIVKELADACAKGGLKFGVYYSTPDWGYPGSIKRDPPNAYSVFEEVSADHEEYMAGQLEELMTNYGPMCELFFDMGSPTPAQSKRFADVVRTLQPDCMINGRVMNDQGDFLTMPDNHIPDEVIDLAWETPATFYLNANTNTWGYKSWVQRPDIEEKITEQLRLMVKVVSQGGNYLLNVGPKADGTIIDYEINILREIGRWMKVNGEAIYDASPSPFKRLPQAWCTTRPGRIFLHITDWPGDRRLVVPGLKNDIKRAYLLADADRDLSVGRQGDDVIVKLPGKAPDPRVTVVALEISGKPKIVHPLIEAGSDGTVDLTAGEAFSHGVYSAKSYKSLYKNVWQSWDFGLDKSGRYEVEVAYRMGKSAKDLVFSVGSERISAKIAGPAGREVRNIGVMTLKKAQRHMLTVKSVNEDENIDIKIEYIKLIPIS